MRIHDYGVEGGAPYMAMELLEGENVADLLDREGRVPLDRAVELVGQAAKALRAAHEAGIVHRDLKPSNLFLARESGEIILKVLDFGIAKETEAAPTRRDPTTAGTVLGSSHEAAGTVLRSPHEAGAAATATSAAPAPGVIVHDWYQLESLLGVALPEAAFAIPITIIILRPFMRAIPAELEDAAAMDGCGRFGFFLLVLVPLSQPALVTVTILSVITSWNNFILPLLVLTDPSKWTLPLGVAQYSSEHSADTAAILAFTTLSMVPALLFFLAAQRRIVGGLSGAVKG